MRQQEDFEVPRWDSNSSSGYPGAAPTGSGVDIPRQRTGYGQPDADSQYPVLLRERQRQPRFRPAADSSRAIARSLGRGGAPTAGHNSGDRQTAIGVTLVFFGLFCLVGAWWLHSDHQGAHEPAVIAQPTATFTYSQAIMVMTQSCTQDSAQLQNMVSSVRASEARAGISESETTVAWELASYTSANTKPESCAPQFAAYAALRTAGR
jgi:hypothetical protein